MKTRWDAERSNVSVLITLQLHEELNSLLDWNSQKIFYFLAQQIIKHLLQFKKYSSFIGRVLKF